MEHRVPIILTVFGGTGDLSKRKLLPALYYLYRHNELENVTIFMCVSPRTHKTPQQHLADAKEYIKTFSKSPVDESSLQDFAGILHYIQVSFEEPKTYLALKNFIAKTITGHYEKYCTIFYLAAPAQYYGTIAQNLKNAGMVIKDGNPLCHTRVVFEKPFGSDLASARELNALITGVFDERNVYRIDHYLGKELVQNILVLRFANTLFEHLWNNKHIDSVQITVAESLGVENRATYFDRAGSLRDIIQNHMMQLLALIAMESPVDLSAQGIRDEKVKLLKTIAPITGQSVSNVCARGQYSSGVINEKPVVGYVHEERIERNSKTETYVALKLLIENWRWSGVPFYLRTGKRLGEQTTEIVVVFKALPVPFFNRDKRMVQQNMLIIRVQPYEGISIEFNTKVPGKKLMLEPVSMDFCHECTFGTNTPEAYVRLLSDLIEGDPTLFTRWDEVEESWKILQPILDAWNQNPNEKIPKYAAGSWGPTEADGLLVSDGKKWNIPKKPSYYGLLAKNETAS